MRWRTSDIRNLVVAHIVGGVLFLVVNGSHLHARCADGWRSSSIGGTGACSHHGGVVSGLDLLPWWRLVLPFAIGSLIFFIPAWRGGMFRRETRDPMAAFTDPVSMEIRQAMKEGSDVHFLYKKENQALQWRTVTPLELTHLHLASHASRCLLAYCHLRQAKRHFVLSRIDQITRVAAVRS
jgi:hypothetical protein